MNIKNNASADEKRGGLSFHACGLAPLYSGAIINLYADLKDWNMVVKTAIADNLVQARTLSSRRRVIHELVSRAETLAEAELAMFAGLGQTEKNCLLWLAICRRCWLIGDFAAEVAYGNFHSWKKTLAPGDYDVFFNRKAQWRPELDMLKDSTRRKMRQTLFLIMREAGIISGKNDLLPLAVAPDFKKYLFSLNSLEQLFFPGLMP